MPYSLSYGSLIVSKIKIYWSGDIQGERGSIPDVGQICRCLRRSCCSAAIVACLSAVATVTARAAASFAAAAATACSFKVTILHFFASEQRAGERTSRKRFLATTRNRPSLLLIVNTMERGIFRAGPRQFFSVSLSSRCHFFSSQTPSAAIVQRCAFTSRQFILTSTNATEQDASPLSCARDKYHFRKK